jgi:Na+-translocating ferredoxin:NAD+ oxidoreductase RnfC subunit
MSAAGTESRAPASAQGRSEPADLGDRPELEQLQRCGVVGLGGAGFPAHAKYRFSADVVVANGAECEPLLYHDKHLLLRRADEVIAGLVRAVELVRAARGVLAIKKKHGAVVEAMQSALRARAGQGPELELHLLANYYPAGDEFTLVQQVTGRTIGPAGLPLHQQVVVNNVGTLRCLHRALAHQEAVTSRLVTVTGEVQSPGVLEVPIGVPLSALLEAAGGATRRDVAWIVGGPMMGTVASDPDTPVAKTTSALLVLPASHPLVRRKLESPEDKLRVARAACCLCKECTDVCPRNALGHPIWPHRLMQSVAAGLTRDTAAYLGALLCCECGLCTHFGCPMYLDPCRMNIEIKQELRQQGVQFPAPAEPVTPSPFWPIKQVPTSRLLARLGLSRYQRELPWLDRQVRCDRVALPLRQGVGQPAVPAVQPGAAVRRGQVVATPGGQISAGVHASIDGVVEGVDEAHIVLRREPGRSP